MTDGCAAEPQWPGPVPVREKAGDASRGTDEEVDGRLQKYTLLIINEPAIDQLSLLKVNTITDSQVQCAAAHLKGDRNSDEGIHASLAGRHAHFLPVLSPIPKQLMPDKDLYPQAFRAGQPEHNSIKSVALMSAASLSLEASQVWVPYVQSTALLRHCLGGKDQAVTLSMGVPVHEAPAWKTFSMSQLQSRHFSLPQVMICHLAVGSVLLRAIAGSSLWAASAGRTQPDNTGALIEMSGTISNTLTPMYAQSKGSQSMNELPG